MPADQSPVVLVADDEADIRELVTIRLRRAGYVVVIACDGDQAVELALEHRPAAIILDGRMPKKSGLEVIERLRAEPHTAEVPIVLLSATVQDADVAAALAAGANDYVKKPFKAAELVDRVERLLS